MNQNKTCGILVKGWMEVQKNNSSQNKSAHHLVATLLLNFVCHMHILNHREELCRQRESNTKNDNNLKKTKIKSGCTNKVLTISPIKLIIFLHVSTSMKERTKSPNNCGRSPSSLNVCSVKTCSKTCHSLPSCAVAMMLLWPWMASVVNLIWRHALSLEIQ